uniref:Uncharacterized protein n=1 Tax=Anguilla anguilla TaxID=7936 RepID=A0A0E9RRY8_ANGAN
MFKKACHFVKLASVDVDLISGFT